ncbi:MAG: FG-GAP repeat protein [Alphaproteobacteria bacterium]|nr:FG-GAP repeat protein [Alphaproteobacteria bacterium]
MSPSLFLALSLACSGGNIKVGTTPDKDSGGGDDTGSGPPPKDDDGDGWFTPDDCNDYDPAINPDATEVCDGVDNDCNGIADVNDAVDTRTYYKDGDGDGYGDPSSEIATCSRPPGFVEDGTDCADDDPTTNPGAPEICNDGADNNCNGQEGECDLSGDVYLTDAAGIWAGEAGGDQAGYALSSAGDIDGDGLDDFLVASPFHDGSATDGGAVYVVSGPGTGTHSLSAATAVWYGTARSENAGTAVSGVGDVNGDGYADFLVGSYHADLGGNDSGAAYLVLGPTSGENQFVGGADAVLVGELSYDVAGESVGGGVDLTGDGTADLLIGSSGQGDGGFQSRGRAYVVSGAARGTVDLSEASAFIDGAESYDRVSRVAALDDMDGDGIGDVAIGAWSAPNNDGFGGAWVFHGPLSGSVTIDDADLIMDGDIEDGRAGWALASAGDVNGDGKTDLLVGAPEADGAASEAGMAWLVFGPGTSGALSGADVTFQGTETRANLGYTVAGGGDLDNDGRADVAIGALMSDLGGTDSGGAWLWYSPAAGTLTIDDADLAIIPEVARDEAAASLAFAGNVNGDCCSDLLIGATEADRGGSGSGAAYLLTGSGI